jgi:hypothetical protein
MAGEKQHSCLDFDLALVEKKIVKLKSGRWARVIRAPSKSYPETEQERYVEMLRCPWCNRKLDT